MKEIGIDIETYSSLDLGSCGVYRYVEAPDFCILLIAYCVDGGPVRCCDLARGERLPAEVEAALWDPGVVKTAFNAAFERVCLSRHFGRGMMDAGEWRCTMVGAARLGLPLSLEQCGEVLGLSEGKMKEGAALIRYFSKPCGGKRHLPEDAPERWETFRRYCMRDVEVEQAIRAKVKRLDAAAFDEELYVLDQRINDRGVLLDRRLAENAARFDSECKERLKAEAQRITGMENPNSPAQIKEYLHRVTGMTVDSLNKAGLDELEGRLKWWPKAQRLLAIRREMGKTSNKKYAAMLQCVCDDGRLHGLLQFCGAARTGRWAGRLVQVQNLPQNHLEDLDRARRMVKAGDMDEFELSYRNPTQVLSELIRTALVAGEGRVLHVCDFSAIEARVIAWLAGEGWVLDVFRQGGDIYCATAGQMFRCRVEKHGENAGLRAKGKIAVLALGYGGGVAALEAMGGGRMGLSVQEEQDIVRKWRTANPRIVKLWSVLERAAVRAIRTGDCVRVNRGIEVSHRWGMLLVKLPSGRTICYPRARLGEETDDGWRGDHEVIEYEGVNQTTKKWGTIRTYGGKLAENVVQAIARDILGTVIIRAERAGLGIVFHIHDEIVVEAEAGQTLEEVEALFGKPIDWCPGLPLKGAGYSTPYYLKD
ncbi:MAG: DNA polymerase [Alloprevotella sp.]